MKEIMLFSDGSSLGNPGPGGYGVILKYKDKEKHLSGGEKNTTNNRMELLGVIVGLESLKEPCRVHIVSDSNYVIKGISEWLEGWINKDFKKIKNEDLWRRYIRAAESHVVTTEWVRGHNGHKENEICDSLARSAAESYKLK